MAALMNVLREEVSVATAGALSGSTPTAIGAANSTISKTIMTAVRQDAVSTVTTQTTTTTTTTMTSSLLKEVALSDGASLLPKSQLEAVNSPREMLSNALQQGFESLGDTMVDKSTLPKLA